MSNNVFRAEGIWDDAWRPVRVLAIVGVLRVKCLVSLCDRLAAFTYALTL